MGENLLNGRYGRQVLFSGVGEQGQQRLLRSRVVVLGCGALGSTSANHLVRAGVGKVTIVDRDVLELSNLQRQVLFDEDDVAQALPKAVAAARKLKRINSEVEITPVVADFHSGTAEQLIAGADVVVDATDNFESRYLINDACVKLGIPWVYGGVVASYGMTMSIIPGETPCFRCVFDEPPPAGSMATADTVGVLAMAVQVVASVQCVEALKLLVGARDRLREGLLHIDLWQSQFMAMKTGSRALNCPSCGRREFEYLSTPPACADTSPCGRYGVQITPSGSERPNLEELARRLASAGRVIANEFLLHLIAGPHELTVFADGRTIIKGTTDPAEAKALRAKYVGV